jgi:uncharacterized cupin superfamily protein
MNVRSNEWSESQAEGRKRRLTNGTAIGATLYELSKGGGIAYHFHPGDEELLIVLSGRLTLRIPEGTHQLGPGDVMHFAASPEGAHGMRHDAEEPVRYVMISTRVSPGATVYPDT